MLCVLISCMFPLLENPGWLEFTHMDAVCTLSIQCERGSAKLLAKIFSSELLSLPEEPFKWGDKTSIGRRRLPVCIRCRVADNAVEIIGQHLQSSTSILKETMGHLVVNFCPTKRRRQLNRHYIARCVTRLCQQDFRERNRTRPAYFTLYV